MARNFYRIFTENNPVMEDSKTFGIPEAKGVKTENIQWMIFHGMKHYKMQSNHYDENTYMYIM